MKIFCMLLLVLNSALAFSYEDPDDKFWQVDDSYWANTFPKLQEIELASGKIEIASTLIVEVFPETRTFKKSKDNPSEFRWWGRVKLGKTSMTYDILSTSDQNYTSYELYSSESNRMYIDAKTYIPGNGFVYTFKRGPGYNISHLPSKYVVKDDSVEEIPQPFYDYERDDIAGIDFEIFSDTSLSTVVARVQKGSKLRLLGVSGRFLNLFLVKTPSGLLGWHELRNVSRVDMKSTFSLSSFDGVF